MLLGGAVAVVMSWGFVFNSAKSQAVVAAGRSSIFHVPACEWAKKINAGFRRDFKTPEDAIRAGLRPCEVCKRLLIFGPGERTEEEEKALESLHPD